MFPELPKNTGVRTPRLAWARPRPPGRRLRRPASRLRGWTVRPNPRLRKAGPASQVRRPAGLGTPKWRQSACGQHARMATRILIQIDAPHASSHPLRRRPGVHCQGRAEIDLRRRSQHRLYRARFTLGKQLCRRLQRPLSRRVAQWRDLLLAQWSRDHHRELATPVRCDPAKCLTRVSAASPVGSGANLRRLAGCADPTSFAG